MTAADGQLALIPAAKPPEHVTVPGRLRVLTWNVQHANAARSRRQAAWIAAQPADVVVLTEVAAGAGGDALARVLGEYGFTVCCPPGPADYRTMVASRTGGQEPCGQVRAGYLPHRCLAVRLRLDDGLTMGVVGLYVPSRGSRERRNAGKRFFQDAVAGLLPGLAARLGSGGPTVIAGDLNVVEPGHQPHHAVFGGWEYGFYRAFGQAGYGDAFRHLHPARADHSWFGRSGGGYRFDHIFCRPAEAVTGCRYLHEPRTAGLSDHSAMTATIAL